jgi:hypothetical protein
MQTISIKVEIYTVLVLHSLSSHLVLDDPSVVPYFLLFLISFPFDEVLFVALYRYFMGHDYTAFIVCMRHVVTQHLGLVLIPMNECRPELCSYCCRGRA